MSTLGVQYRKLDLRFTVGANRGGVMEESRDNQKEKIELAEQDDLVSNESCNQDTERITSESSSERSVGFSESTESRIKDKRKFIAAGVVVLIAVILFIF